MVSVLPEGRVADDVVQMPVDIKIRMFLCIFQFGLEISPYDFLFVLALPVFRIVGIRAVQHMGGSDDEVKIMGFGQNGIGPHAGGLKADLDAEEEPDPSFVRFPELQQLVQVGIHVQDPFFRRDVRAFGIVEIVVLGKAQRVETRGDPRFDHGFHGGFGVSGVVRVHVLVGFDGHGFLLPLGVYAVGKQRLSVVIIAYL